MPILNIQTDFLGQSGVVPRQIRIFTNDSLAIVTAPNYLHGAQSMGYTFYPSDSALVTYIANNVQVTNEFDVQITANVITLVQDTSGVTLPVVSGDIAVFDGTTGKIKDIGISPSDPTQTKVVTVVTPTVAGKVAAFADVNGTVSNQTPSGAGNVNNLLYSSIVNPDTNANILFFDVTVTFTDIAIASKTLISSGFLRQYRIINLQLNSGGTNFAGGDRLGIVSDGTTAYSIIPAANLQTLVNANWGSAQVPYPASAPRYTITAAGQSLVFAATGGTTNYTSGSMTFTVEAVRVA